jgi:HK97 family phage prohead protease
MISREALMADKPLVLETRTVSVEFEFRESVTEVGVEGYASTFNQWYSLGAFDESVDSDAFVRTGIPRADEQVDPTALPDVRFLVDHEGQPLARTKSGTLFLSTDSTGLLSRAPSLDKSDPDVQRLLPKMRRGDLDQMSFAFRVPSGGDVWNDQRTKRTLREINMNGGDVSVVTYPANPDTSVSVRSRDERDAQCVFLHAMVADMRSGRDLSPENLLRLRNVLADLTGEAEPTMGSPAPVAEALAAPETGRALRAAQRLAESLAL